MNMKVLELNTVESSELVDQTFHFWFNDNDHIRSPFPSYIRDELKVKAVERFHKWADSLKPEAKDELNDEMVGEKFEEIIFETATNLVKTEDEKTTLLYPFLPRVGDVINDQEGAESKVLDRGLIKNGDDSFLKVYLEKIESKEKWETKFELPV